MKLSFLRGLRCVTPVILLNEFLRFFARLDVGWLLNENERLANRPVFTDGINQNLKQLGLLYEALELVEHKVRVLFGRALRLGKFHLGEREFGVQVNSATDDWITVVCQTIETKFFSAGRREFERVNREFVAVVADIVRVGNVGVAYAAVSEETACHLAGLEGFITAKEAVS